MGADHSDACEPRAVVPSDLSVIWQQLRAGLGWRRPGGLGQAGVAGAVPCERGLHRPMANGLAALGVSPR